MLHKRHARSRDIPGGRRNRRRTLLSAKAERAKTDNGRNFRPGSSVTETNLRTRLGQALSRHDAFGHSKNSATEKRRRPQRRGRASLRSTRSGCVRRGEHSTVRARITSRKDWIDRQVADELTTSSRPERSPASHRQLSPLPHYGRAATGHEPVHRHRSS